MGAGAIFLIVVVGIVFAVGAALLLGVGSTLRRRKMDPEGDKLEGGTEGGADAQQPGHRPEHVRVSTEKRVRVIANR